MKKSLFLLGIVLFIFPVFAFGIDNPNLPHLTSQEQVIVSSSSGGSTNSSVLELYNITTFDFHATSDTASGIFDTSTGDLIQIFARGIVTDGSTVADTQLYLNNVLVDFMERGGTVTRTFWLEYNFYEDSGTSINVSINTTSPSTVNMDDIKIVIMKYHNTTISGGGSSSSSNDTNRWNYYGGIGVNSGGAIPVGACSGVYGDQYLGLGYREQSNIGNYPMRARSSGIIDYAVFEETIVSGFNSSGNITLASINHTILINGADRYYLGTKSYNSAGQTNMANYTGLSIPYSAGDLIVAYDEQNFENTTGYINPINEFCYVQASSWIEGVGNA